MSSFADVRLEVMSSSPKQINQIEEALQQPREEVLAWAVSREDQPTNDSNSKVAALVGFTPVLNLSHKARRFQNSFRDWSWSTVWRHVYFVSEDFPRAMFLCSYWDMSLNYSGKIAIRAGRNLLNVHDGCPKSQVLEWTLLNIFTPPTVPRRVVADFWKHMIPGTAYRSSNRAS